MTRILPVQLSDEHAGTLESIAAATHREPEVLARDWLIERLVAYGPQASTSQAHSRPVLAADSAAERLRDLYKPDDVVVMLVGESAPAGGTFFYQADSNLFHATREAFIRGMGPMPEGEAFLQKFKELGFWLYDMVGKPVNKQLGRPRAGAVSAGVAALADYMRELDPDFVVGIKTSLEGPIKGAATRAEYPAHRILILPFPLYQWREEYISGLGRFLGGAGDAITMPADGPQPPSRLTLHLAMAKVLETAGGDPVPARQIANEVAVRGLYVRQDGTRADYQQILLRAKKYPAMFEVTPSGIKLKSGRV